MKGLEPSSYARTRQRLMAVARHTIKAAFRFRMIPWLILMLGVSVFTIPYMITHNGTAEMFAQVQLTYSLMAVSIIMGVSTVWLSCGILNQDFIKHHIVLIASKPIARWEIWLGKWLGILALNTVLLTIAGGCIYGVLMLHAKGLSNEEQERLHASILTSRRVVKEAPPDEEAEIEQLYAKRSQNADVAAMDPGYVREKLREEVRWMNQLVKPRHRRVWNLKLGSGAGRGAQDQVQLRVKFYASWFENTDEHPTVWIVGNPDSPNRWEKQMNLNPMMTHEWSVPASLINADGTLHVECQNYTESSLVFRVEDGLEVLYSDGGFLMNYAKSLVVILSRLTLLSALGLWAATFASLPVATMMILTLILVTSSDQLFKTIATEGTISAVHEHDGHDSINYLDWLMVPIFTALHHFTESLKSIAAVERLVTGRSIPTGTWLAHLGLVWGVLCGLLAGWGIYIFQRKELDK
jgi:hypothetical protein